MSDSTTTVRPRSNIDDEEEEEEEIASKKTLKILEDDGNLKQYNKNELIPVIEYQGKKLKVALEKVEELEWQLEDEIRKVIILPHTKKPKTKKGEKTLKDCYVYFITCEEDIAFSDSEKHQFKKFILVTRRPYEEEFSFSNMELYFPDIDLSMEGQAGAVWFVVLDWIVKDIPIIMSVFTEKDCEEYLDCTVDAESIVDLKSKVLTRIYYQNRAFLKRYDLEIEELNAWNYQSKKKAQILLQKVKNELAQKSDDPFLQKKKGIYVKKWTMFLACSGWLFTFILLGILL